MKKQRGQRQKLKKWMSFMEESTKEFPLPDFKYEHWHVFSHGQFLNNPRTAGRIKTAAIQFLIDRTHYLYNLKPKELTFCKVVCLISMPDFCESQIIIFFDHDYFMQFFQRNNPEQQWIPITNKSMKSIRNLHIFSEFREAGYCEIFRDETENREYSNELWFYGEIDSPPSMKA